MSQFLFLNSGVDFFDILFKGVGVEGVKMQFLVQIKKIQWQNFITTTKNFDNQCKHFC